MSFVYSAIGLLLGMAAVWIVLTFWPFSHQLQGPCYADDFDRCLGTQRELQEISTYTCDGDGRRVCLVPLGLISTDIMLHLSAHFEEVYGLEARIMLPTGIADYVVHRNRQQPNPLPVPEFMRFLIPDISVEEDHDQMGGVVLIEYMKAAFPEEAADPDVVLIGITPLDLYYEETDWRWAFGVRGLYDDPKAVISTFRMNPEAYGGDYDEELLHSRARKMTTKYVGLLYYGLSESSDPDSALYDHLYSLRELDRVDDLLPLEELTPQPSAP